MSRLVSSTRARVLTAVVSSAAVALLGLGTVSTASAAPPGQISGTVTNADGDGIKGIEVTAFDAETGEFGAHGDDQEGRHLHAQEAGAVVVHGPVPGRLGRHALRRRVLRRPSPVRGRRPRGRGRRPRRVGHRRPARPDRLRQWHGDRRERRADPQHLHRLLLPGRGRLPLGRGLRRHDQRPRPVPRPVRGSGRLRHRVHRLERHLRQRVLRRPPEHLRRRARPRLRRSGHHGHRRRAGVRRSPVGHRDRLRGQRPGRHRGSSSASSSTGTGRRSARSTPTSPTRTAPTRSTACRPAPTGSSSTTRLAPTSPSSTTTSSRTTRARPSR